MSGRGDHNLKFPEVLTTERDDVGDGESEGVVRVIQKKLRITGSSYLYKGILLL